MASGSARRRRSRQVRLVDCCWHNAILIRKRTILEPKPLSLLAAFLLVATIILQPNVSLAFVQVAPKRYSFQRKWGASGWDRGVSTATPDNLQGRTTRPTTSTTAPLLSYSSASAAEAPAPTAAGTESVDTSLNRFQSGLVRSGMVLYVACMCLALPLALIPQLVLRKLHLVHRRRAECMALGSGQFCSRWLLRLIPFCRIEAITGTAAAAATTTTSDPNQRRRRWRRRRRPPLPYPNPEPAVWVCNHMSMLDVFVLLGVDRKLRGRNRRPIKIVYWKGLEDNPITKILFTQCGFIPVQMAANGSGNDNEYDVSSFRKLLKDAKEAFADGFDIGVLPEGQLNPHPERGLLPVFPGAYTLAKRSGRPIYMMAIHGSNALWNAQDDQTLLSTPITGRAVKVRAYPIGRKYRSAREFVETFTKVVGTFGMLGRDLPEPELTRWLEGSSPSTATKLAGTPTSSSSSSPASGSGSTGVESTG